MNRKVKNFSKPDSQNSISVNLRPLLSRAAKSPGIPSLLLSMIPIVYLRHRLQVIPITQALTIPGEVLRTIVQTMICIVLLVSVCSDGYSQTTTLDSLKNWVSASTGREQVDAMVEYAQALRSIDNTTAGRVATDAYELADKIHYERGMASAMIIQGVIAYSQFNNPEARQIFNKSIFLSHRIQANDIEGYALAYLGMNYQTAGQLDSAMVYYRKAFPLLKDGSNPFYLSFLYLALSDYYEISGEPSLQFNYLEKCWSIRDANKFNYYLPFIGTRMASYYVNRGEYEKGHIYLERSIEALGKDTVQSENIALIQQRLAIVLAMEGKISQALTMSNNARQFYEDNGYTLELANLLIETGEVYEEIGNYEAGLKNYFDALKIAEDNHFVNEIIKIEIGIAWIYYDMNDDPNARKYNDMAIQSSRIQHYPKEEAAAANLMGLIYTKGENFNGALEQFRLALRLRRKANHKIGIAGTLFNIGLLYEQKHQLDSALYYEKQSLEQEESMGHALGMAYSYQKLGMLYTQLKEYAKAEECLQKAEVLSKKIKSGTLLISVFANKRDLLRAQGKLDQSLNYAILYENLKDSIFTNALGSRIASLENVNELDQKNREIRLLNQTRQLQENKLLMQNTQIRQQWIITLAIALGLILSSAFAFLLYRNNQQIRKLNLEIKGQAAELTKSNALLHKQQEEISKINHELVRSNDALASQRDKVEAQNVELARARNIIEQKNMEILLRNETLEDEVEKRTIELVNHNYQLEQFAFMSSHNLRAPVARLLGLGKLLELPDTSAHDETIIREKLIITAKEMDDVVRDLSTVLEIKNHSAEHLMEIDFAEALELVKVKFEKEILATGAVILSDFSMAPLVTTVRSYLDSILYHLLSNAIKYRSPRHSPVITIRTEHRGNRLCLVVGDNGLGMDLVRHRHKLFMLHSRLHHHVAGRGLGLYLIKSQMNAMGGAIDVESEPDKGTIFHLYFEADLG